MSNISTTPAVFNFNTHVVRTIVKDGEPWFVASDVCSALGYKNVSQTIGDHLDADERMIALVPRTPIDSIGVETNTISESGLYALVLRSRKPEARKFAKWVTSEVLPAIRKTGKFDVKTASGPLTKEMQEAVKAMVIERVKLLPHEKRGGASIKLWSALKSKFGVPYKEISTDNFSDAISLLARMQVEWEVVEPEALPAPAKVSYHYPLSAADPHDRYFANASLSPRVLLDPKNRTLELELIEQLEKDGHDVTGVKMRILAMRDALEYCEAIRKQMEKWGLTLKAMAENTSFHTGERGKNVLFARRPDANNPIDRQVFRDQM